MEVKLFESFDEAKSLLPNKKPRLVKANGKNICVIRIEEELFAFQNECPHQGASLHHGIVNYLNQMVCPLHAYRFDLATGEVVEKSCKSLRVIPILIKDEEIYLKM